MYFGQRGHVLTSHKRVADIREKTLKHVVGSTSRIGQAWYVVTSSTNHVKYINDCMIIIGRLYQATFKEGS